jgi:hypothetical protein
MGFGNGIGMGWPMASSSSSANLAYFAITEWCGGITPRDWTSQLINTNLYNPGDYVEGIDDRGNIFRLRLGEIVLLPGKAIFQISGPTYISCPIYRAFNIENVCQGEMPVACTTHIDITYYSTGDYVYSPLLNTRVRLGVIVPEDVRCEENIPVEGPKYNSCTEGLVRYQIIQCCNQFLPEGAATQLVNSNLYTYGDYVYSPSLDSRVTLGSITESVEVEYQIQGPAFNGCE